MAQYFDEQKWSETVRYADWYLRLADEYRKLTKQAERSREISEEIKEGVCQFFEDRLAKKRNCAW